MSTKTKRVMSTPGPWSYDETTLSICRGIISVEDVQAFQVSPKQNENHAIAYLPCDVARAEQEANAHLIAAAPDLLEAAKLTAQHFERNHVSGNFQDDDEHEAWTSLRAAIAKAEAR